MDIRLIRLMIEEGMSDKEIARELADIAAESAAAAEEEEWAYGPRDEDDDFCAGPSRLRCDDYYSRNDAGEWLGVM